MKNLSDYKLPKGKVLVFKSLKNNMTAHGGFLWPESGEISAPDWKPSSKCGYGLHGWLWGNGDYGLKVSDSDAKWLVMEVDSKGIVDLGGKVKFKKANVIYCGAYAPGFSFIRKEYWKSLIVEPLPEGSSSASGDYGHSSASGDSGHSSAFGEHGTAACLGTEGRAKCGKNGSIILTFWDENNRRRHIIGYEGEEVEAGIWYEVKNGKLVKCENQ